MPLEGRISVQPAPRFSSHGDCRQELLRGDGFGALRLFVAAANVRAGKLEAGLDDFLGWEDIRINQPVSWGARGSVPVLGMQTGCLPGLGAPGCGRC